MENWKPVVGYENIYEVSDLGRVRRLKCKYALNDRIVKSSRRGCINNTAMSVSLSNKNVSKNYNVHRLVAMAFIPNPHNKPTVNHIDGDRANNKLSNLEWATQKEQIRHSYDVLNHKAPRGEKHHNVRLTDKEVVKIRERFASGETASSIRKDYDVSEAHLYDIKNYKKRVMGS
jgi:hypothetical protein